MSRRRFLYLAAVFTLVHGSYGCEDNRTSPTQPKPAPTNAPPPPPGEKLAINRATSKQLEALPGVGPEKAKSIIASRNARGGRFEQLEDLLKIDGVGDKTLDAIRPYVTLD